MGSSSTSLHEQGPLSTADRVLERKGLEKKRNCREKGHISGSMSAFPHLNREVNHLKTTPMVAHEGETSGVSSRIKGTPTQGSQPPGSGESWETSKRGGKNCKARPKKKNDSGKGEGGEPRAQKTLLVCHVRAARRP